MTIYSGVSKQLGHEPKTVSIPSKENARLLATKVRAKHLNSFKEAFSIVRFGAPETLEEVESLNLIVSAFVEVTPFWQRV